MITTTTDKLEKSIPRADDAELAVVGSAILSEEATDEAAALITHRDFWDHRYAVLFREIVEMRTGSSKVDTTTLAMRLKERKLWDEIGGAKTIAEAMQSVPHASHARFYAQHVANASTLRQTLEASERIARDVYHNGHEPDAVLGRAQAALSQLLDRAAKTDFREIGDLLRESLANLERRMAGEDSLPPITTGIKAIDNGLAGGLRPSQLAILAARPSVGKSALALQMAVGAAAHRPVLVVSLEMAGDELADRLLSQHSGVDGHRLRNGTIDASERRDVIAAAAELQSRHLRIDDAPGMTVRDVGRAARRVLRRDGDLGLVVIDYLQLLTPADERAPREQQVAGMARGLKLLAKELKCPIVALCQLSRDVEKQGREPRLSDLRESGAIEQDADVVAFLHRVDDDGKVRLLIRKQRSGPVGEVDLTWQRKQCRFIEPETARFKQFDGFNAGDDSGSEFGGNDD